MSGRKIVINPVTRIEGHAKITLQLDDAGKVVDARFHVDEFRGFEKFCEGRIFTEMPAIVPRICGICPVSHGLAAAKACEKIMRVTVPPAADRLRRVIHLGQVISSHALSFFHLSSPDMLLGWDAAPATRNILGVAEKFPDLARRGIRLRKFGQEISERITGKKIHMIGLIPGGMAAPLTEENRKALHDWLPEVYATTRMALDIFKKYRDENAEEVRSFASFLSLYMGLAGPGGEHELYDGALRFVDTDGAVVAEKIAPDDYLKFIAERPVAWSYLKMPYYKPLGYEKGFYRVGPLARLNVATRMQTPQAEKELREFKALGAGKPVQGSFYYHYARLVEILACIELIERLLDDPSVTASTELQARAGRNQAEGVGCSEAPRGTLFHHYTVDENGVLTKVNLLIATGQNNPAMSRAVLEVAQKYVDGADATGAAMPLPNALNRVEAAIRCYDPCLSCSTHALGALPLKIEILGARGQRLHVIQRD